MKPSLLIFVIGMVALAAGSLGQQKSERARAMIAVLEHIKSTQTGSPAFLLSPTTSGPGHTMHDSALLAEISSVALRITAPSPPYVLDTFVLSIAVPTETAAGLYTVRAGGYMATRGPSGCYVGGPSNSYEVNCTSGQCQAKVLTKISGSGRCD